MVLGLRPLPYPVTMGVSARRLDGGLAMAVADTGAGFDAALVRERLGLGNTRARLDAVYRGDFTLDIESERGEGTTVRLTLPFRAGARARSVDVRIP
jgi:sensor histidine kinase YesM